jgi:uncharacterized ParB-like nuclease family protein
MALTTEINVADIVANAAMMMRQKLDKPTVTKYAKDMQGGAEFPPILIFQIDDQFVLADGFHRHSAYQRLGIEKIRAEVRVGTLDDAILAAVKADAHEGLARTNYDKEKAVKALLASEQWRKMSDSAIAHVAGVGDKFVAKQRKLIISGSVDRTSNAINKATRLGKDGKHYPATRSKPMVAKPIPAAPSPIPASVPSAYRPPPLPKFTPEQMGAPPPEQANEQDPNSPPGVTRAQAWSAKHGHVHLRPLSDKLKAEKERTVTSFIAALRDLARPAAELLRHDIDPDDLIATMQEMKTAALRVKFEDRMDAIEPLLTRLNAINAKRTKKTAAA